MGDFNDYRNKWVYKCTSCGTEITAFRNCGEITTCRCGGSMPLAEFIEAKHLPDIDYKAPAIQTFKPYFDVTIGKEVTSKRQIEEYCKKNDMVYAGDKELTQQCAQNKAENEKRFNQEFRDGLTRQLMEKLN